MALYFFQLRAVNTDKHGQKASANLKVLQAFLRPVRKLADNCHTFLAQLDRA